MKIGDLVVVRSYASSCRVIIDVLSGEKGDRYEIGGLDGYFKQEDLTVVKDIAEPGKQFDFNIKGLDADRGYYVNNIWRSRDEISAAVPSEQANRYNAGKPELSYVLDFPKAFNALASFVPLSAPVTDSLVDNLINKQPLPVIITRLFSLLQSDLIGYQTPNPVTSVGYFISFHPDAINEFVKVCANGALKYDRDNWKKGFAPYTLLDCAIRHNIAYITGDIYDVVDVKTLAREDLLEHFNGDVVAFKKQFATHHLAHVIWNLMVIIETKSP